MKTLTIDIETTGLPQKGHTYEINFMDFPYILSIAFKVDDQETQDFIINQEGREVPKEASDINGITTEIANASPFLLPEILNKLLEIGNPEFVIGYNIYFDTSIIKANILRLIKQERLSHESFQRFEDYLHKDKRIDVMRKFIKFCGLGAYPKLTACYSKLFNEKFNAHNGKSDVDATYRCFKKGQEIGII